MSVIKKIKETYRRILKRPNLKVGDFVIAKSYKDFEEWEERDLFVYRIMEVGKSKYRYVSLTAAWTISSKTYDILDTSNWSSMDFAAFEKGHVPYSGYRTKNAVTNPVIKIKEGTERQKNIDLLKNHAHSIMKPYKKDLLESKEMIYISSSEYKELEATIIKLEKTYAQEMGSEIKSSLFFENGAIFWPNQTGVSIIKSK